MWATQSSIILLASITGAAVFVPASPQARTTTSLQMADFSKEIGAQLPLGYFNLLGIMKDADQEKFDLYRKIETKHGRIAVVAVLGTSSLLRVTACLDWRNAKLDLVGLLLSPEKFICNSLPLLVFLRWATPLGKTRLKKNHLEKSKWDVKAIKRKKATSIELNKDRAAQMGLLYAC